MEVPAPIVLFVYNRPWHTKQTIQALLKNDLVQDSELFIYSDAPKDSNDEKNVLEVRRYIRTVLGFKSVSIIERKQNWGLAKSIINGVTEVIKQYGRVIVLEDDLITSPYFLEYMNIALNMYECQKEVISIHGYIYPVKVNLPKSFFLKGADCWGWATWQRGWDLFETDGKKLLDKLNSKKLNFEFDFSDSHPYSQMLADQVAGRNNSWAIRWYATAFLHNKLTLYPGKSFVQNIGLDSSGTHCKNTNNFDIEIETNKHVLELIEIKENIQARRAVENYFKKLKPNILSRIYYKLKNAVK